MDADIAVQPVSARTLGAIHSLDDLPEAFTRFLTTTRRHLHQHPEIGFKEKETSAFIRQTLESYGLVVNGPLAGTGLYVDIQGKGPGHTVGYRADIDALPQQDAKRVPYASMRKNVAHLCGHDAHTTVGIGVALLLHALRDRFNGTVRVFFQPNEEGTPSGAPRMIEDGVLDGLEAAYAIHVDPTLELGRFGLVDGPATASADRFTITLEAPSSGHSARPHESVDTLWVATQMLNTLYQLVGRVSDPRLPAVFTPTWIRSGDAFNVIPQQLRLGGTLRCQSLADRDQLIRKIKQIATQVVGIHGASAEVKLDTGAPPVINDPDLIDNVRNSIRAHVGESAIYEIELSSMGGEDFAHYLAHVPGALVRVGTASGPETRYPLHDSNFDIDERALVPAARLMTHTLMRHLEQSPLH